MPESLLIWDECPKWQEVVCENVSSVAKYHDITREFGRELTLTAWWSAFATAKIKISYSHIMLYAWQSHIEQPRQNLGLAIKFTSGKYCISSYMV